MFTLYRCQPCVDRSRATPTLAQRVEAHSESSRAAGSSTSEAHCRAGTSRRSSGSRKTWPRRTRVPRWPGGRCTSSACTASIPIGSTSTGLTMVPLGTRATDARSLMGLSAWLGAVRFVFVSHHRTGTVCR